MESAALRTTGTRGFLLWVREYLPWVYAEYVRRGVGAVVNPGLGAPDTSDYSMGDITTDSTTGATWETFGDSSDAFDATVTYGSQTDPATTAPASPPTPAQASWLSDVAQAAGQYLLTKNKQDIQNKVLNTQLSLAQRGLPLMDLSQLNLGLPNRSTLGLGANSQSTLLVVAGIVGAVWLLGSLGRRV